MEDKLAFADDTGTGQRGHLRRPAWQMAALAGAIKDLEEWSWAKRSRVAGERVDRVWLDPGLWQHLLDNPAEYTDLAELADRGPRTVRDQPAEQRARLEELAEFARFLADKMPALATEWQQRLDTLRGNHHVPGAALAVLADGRIHEFASGVLYRGTGVAVTPDSVFLSGSLAKAYTATAVMRLAERGAVDLDARIADLVPEFATPDPVATKEITVRQLLSHTGGLTCDFTFGSGGGDDGVSCYVAAAGEVALDCPPGTALSSSSLGYAVLGRLIGMMPRSAGPYGRVIVFAGDVARFAKMHLDGGVAAGGSRVLSAATVTARRPGRSARARPVRPAVEPARGGHHAADRHLPPRRRDHHGLPRRERRRTHPVRVRRRHEGLLAAAGSGPDPGVGQGVRRPRGLLRTGRRAGGLRGADRWHPVRLHRHAGDAEDVL